MRKEKRCEFRCLNLIRDLLQLQHVEPGLPPTAWVGDAAFEDRSPYSADPEERRVELGTKRKRWGNHLHLQFSQKIRPCLWSKRSWLEKPSSLYAFLYLRSIEKGRRSRELQSSQNGQLQIQLPSVQRRKQSAQERLLAILWLVEKKKRDWSTLPKLVARFENMSAV